MRIFDEDGNELEEIDETEGYTTVEQRFVRHHDAILPVEEEWHYEVVREYPNGGTDVEKVVDVEGVEAQDAWDEYEDVLVYHPYRDPSDIPDEDPDEDMDDTPSQFDRIEAQVLYTALMTDTLLEE